MFSLAFLALLHHHLFYLIHCPMLPVDNRITFNPFILYRALATYQPLHLASLRHLSNVPKQRRSSISLQLSVPRTKLNVLFPEQNSMLTNMCRPLTMNSQTDLAYNHLIVGLYLHFVKCFFKQISQFVRKRHGYTYGIGRRTQTY